MSTKSQNLDQALKGGALGVWVYLASRQNLDAEVIAVLTPAIAYGLAWLSTKVGDPTIASFLTKAASAPKKKA
jgi:hypothetical protein